MSDQAPKLYVNKPKKAQLKQFQQQNLKAMGSATPTMGSTTPTMGSTTISGGGGGSSAFKPPEPPKESFARRYKFLWPLLLGVNFAVGAYLFTRTKKKEIPVEEEPSAVHPSETSTTPAVDKPLPYPPPEPVKLLEPIPENQQRELFKWILEEKRKVKPKDSEEKKRIDEEKAILKQFIRAKSIPTI